jgi:hypothetical protein
LAISNIEHNRALTKGAMLLVWLLLIWTGTSVSAQYYGMKFLAHEYSLDQRSGLNLTPDQALEVKDKLELQFHLRLEPNQSSYYGYVFRMIFGDQTVDLMHGIYPENPNNFEVILGDKISKIAFHIPIEELLNDWIHLRFEFDFKTEKVFCFVNEKVLEDDLINIDNKEGFHLMFGAHSYTTRLTSTDVPGMIIRDVEVKSRDQYSYSWPLNEIEGTRAHSEPEGQDGNATNPEWLLKHHNTWNTRLELELDGVIKSAYDARNDKLYIVSEDAVIVYDVVNNSKRSIELNTPSPVRMITELIFDTLSNSLISYSLDNQYISRFDFDTKQWSSYSPGDLNETVYWQHNRFIGPDGSLITLGGYGHFMYKNSLMAWNPETKQFQSLAYSGTFHPRYLAGAGYNSKDGQYYVLGGYGSESGNQRESPGYYYDILQFSLEDRSFSTVFEFTDTQMEFCFASSLVFDEANNMYALSFSKYQFDNQLQLLRIPLDKPELIQLGNPIEYSFLDIQSQADLYYCRRTTELIAVSSYNAENSTSLAVHSIAFPPQPFISHAISLNQGKRSILWYIGGAMLLLIALFIAIRLPKKKKESPRKVKPATTPRETIQKTRENSIILFGGFQVIDKEGKDITAQFTPLPKKLFLFILLHSLRSNKGVSSNTMYETFWFDKSVESARNNRAVNIVKLKSLLENVDTASISKETGYWKFDFDPSSLYVDYLEYLQIVRGSSEPTRDDIVDLLAIVENKPFLNNTNADWLDPFKSEVSNEIIDTFLKYLGNSDDDPEFLLHLTKCIFIVDQVSEEALKVQCRLLIKQGKHSLARQAYTSFINVYKQLYDEDYGLSFNQVIDET